MNYEIYLFILSCTLYLKNNGSNLPFETLMFLYVMLVKVSKIDNIIPSWKHD
jgi:hypothetical protein